MLWDRWRSGSPGQTLVAAHSRRKPHSLLQCATAGVLLAALTYGGFASKANSLTIGLLYMSLVLTVALRYGFWQASVTSVLAVGLLDFFFLPPFFSFQVADSQGWVALAVFEVTALAVSRLSAQELKHAREATIHRTGMAQLYELSRCSLLLDMHQAPGPQLVVLIHRIFGADGVAIFDADSGRQDRMGDWGADQEDVARECYLHAAEGDVRPSRLSRRLLRSGPGIVGTLVVRGEMNPLVADALASLAAIAMDRHQRFEKEERAETARKSEELRGAVMDALAHEFKTPLTAVHTASSGLLFLGGLTQPQIDLVTLIDDGTERLNELCTRLLKAARVESRRVGLQADEINVQAMMQDVLSKRDSNGDRGRVKVLVEDPELKINADRGLLVMMFEQLVDNALKYSSPGSLIEVIARQSHSEVTITVHNFGSTIRIEDRERIFDRFYRSPETIDAVPGTGIGLSVVKKAAEAHQGHVWVISDEREGTTFFLSLPNGARRSQ
jgi:two-component system sensor histidine kinase KdpD